MIRYKARFVAKGFTQTEGIDFNETFASVAKMKSFRMLLAKAAHDGMKLDQLDIKTAFLYGDIKETVYVGFSDGTKRVCKLNKALYGSSTKQASLHEFEVK